MNKKFGVLLSGIMLATSLTTGAFAQPVEPVANNYVRASIIEELVNVDIEDTFYAEQLLDLGVLETEEGLDEELVRIDGFVTIYNLLNNEEDKEEVIEGSESIEVKNETPFTDVPEWALKEVNYLYNKGLINGVGKTSIEPERNMSANEFMTIILRIKGYNDVLGDFDWKKSVEKAVQIEIISESAASQIKEDFTMRNMSYIIYSSIEISIQR